MEPIKKSPVLPSTQKLLTSGNKLHMKRKKKGHKSKLNQASSIILQSEFDIPGVSKVVLSTLSQKIVGCVVGEDLTAEDAWVFVKKYKIEDNIDMHDSSEFLPLNEFIRQYPEDEILIGYNYNESIRNDMFFVVHTLQAKNTVLRIVERQISEMKLRLRCAVHKPIRPWYTWGSEVEVDASLIQNNRPLFETELYIRFPTKNDPQLQIRKVEDVKDGYVELLPDPRYPITNVNKKRIDTGVQATPTTKCSGAQTILNYPTNQWTQYEYEYREKALDANGRKDFKEFIDQRITKLNETIHLVSHINLHSDDYSDLNKCFPCREFSDRTLEFRIFACYVDREHCLGKYISDCAWDPFMSGTLAVCYSDASFTALTHDPKNTMGEVEGVEIPCFILIWSYIDVISPKLYLETPRPVNTLTFCPHKKNILVGGCKNGQIIIWDLTGKLERVEKIEVYTIRQLMNRANLKQYMKWAIDTHDIAKVKPVFISNLLNSHRAMVSAFTWINYKYEITPEGKHRKLEDPNATSCSFVSGGLDGTLLVWDINDFKSLREKAGVFIKTKRLSNPADKKALGPIFEKIRMTKFDPIFKMVVSDERDVPFPVSGLIRTTRFMFYDTLYPEKGKDNPEVRTYYKFSQKQIPFVPYPFMVVTAVGKMSEVEWRGYDFKTGKCLNSTRCTLFPQTIIHDGPITSCFLNQIAGKCILTIGGTCFAIWNINDKYSLLWRKAKVGKYLSGGWTVHNPAYILAIRSDGMIEWWNFLASSWAPIKVVPISSHIMNLYGTLTAPHCRKNTFAVADSSGSLIILEVPRVLDEISANDLEEFHELLKKTIQKKAALRKFMEKKLEEIGPRTEEEISATKSKSDMYFECDTRRLTEIEKMDRIFGSVHWKNLSEQFNYEAMLKRKKLNLKELAKQRTPLQKMARDANQRRFKQEQMIHNKEKLFRSVKNQLFEQINKKSHAKLHNTDVDNIDIEALLADYDEVEKRALSYIQYYPFNSNTTLSRIIKEGKARGRVANSIIFYTPSHIRYIRRKTQQFSMQKQAESSSNSDSFDSNYATRLFV